MRVGDLALLRKFCADDHSQYSDVFNLFNYRGGPRVNYDLCATNGKILLCACTSISAQKRKSRRCDAPAEWWWAMSAIADEEPEVLPAKDATLSRVSKSVHEQLKALPKLEFKEVRRVRIWHYGNGKPRQKWAKINDEKVVFFRFEFGTGFCVAAPPAKRKGAQGAMSPTSIRAEMEGEVVHG